MLAVLRLWVGILLVPSAALGCAAEVEESGAAHESLEPRRPGGTLCASEVAARDLEVTLRRSDPRLERIDPVLDASERTTVVGDAEYRTSTGERARGSR